MVSDEWVFTAELSIPQKLIAELNLIQHSEIDYSLADGTIESGRTFLALIEWFGAERIVQVIAANIRFPLIGVSVIQAHELIINYRKRTVLVAP